MIRETRGLCLDVEVMGRNGAQIEMRDVDEDAFRAAEQPGIDLTRPERGGDEDDERHRGAS